MTYKRFFIHLQCYLSKMNFQPLLSKKKMTRFTSYKYTMDPSKEKGSESSFSTAYLFSEFL